MSDKIISTSFLIAWQNLRHSSPPKQGEKYYVSRTENKLVTTSLYHLIRSIQLKVNDRSTHEGKSICFHYYPVRYADLSDSYCVFSGHFLAGIPSRSLHLLQERVRYNVIHNYFQIGLLNFWVGLDISLIISQSTKIMYKCMAELKINLSSGKKKRK